MPLTDEHRKHLERTIVETIATALEKGMISQDVLPSIAKAILARVDGLENQDQVTEFLTELAVQWPIFEPLQTIELGRVKSLKEAEVARQVLQLAHSGSIEEAIALAKTMTSQTP